MSEYLPQKTEKTISSEPDEGTLEKKRFELFAQRTYALSAELNDYAARLDPSAPADTMRDDIHRFELSLENLKDDIPQHADTSGPREGFLSLVGAFLELSRNELKSESVGKEARIFACEYFKDNMDILEEIVQEGIGRHIYNYHGDVGDALRAVGRVLDTGKTDLRPDLFVSAFEFLERNMDGIEQAIHADRESDVWEFNGKLNNYAAALLPILEANFRYHPLALKAAKITAEVFAEQIHREGLSIVENEVGYLLDQLRMSGGGKLDTGRQEELFLYEVLRSYGVPPNDLFGRWQDSVWNQPDRFSAIVRRNFVTLCELERKGGEGATAYLQEHFGICDFVRYPTDLLVEQYKNRDAVHMPYGLILNPYGDHDGAFYSDRYLWGKLVVQLAALDQPITLRVIEAGNKREVGRFALSLPEKYGAAQFGIIGGHGDSSGLTLGRGGSMHRLEIEDAEGSGVARAGNKLFERGAPIIWNSCFGGAEGGLGKRFAEKSDFVFIGTDASTAIESIRVEMRDGKPEFTVEYHEKGSSRTYKRF